MKNLSMIIAILILISSCQNTETDIVQKIASSSEFDAYMQILDQRKSSIASQVWSPSEILEYSRINPKFDTGDPCELSKSHNHEVKGLRAYFASNCQLDAASKVLETKFQFSKLSDEEIDNIISQYRKNFKEDHRSMLTEINNTLSAKL